MKTLGVLLIFSLKMGFEKCVFPKIVLNCFCLCPAVYPLVLKISVESLLLPEARVGLMEAEVMCLVSIQLQFLSCHLK